MVNFHRYLLETEQSSPPGIGEGVNHSSRSETSFDTNMVIVLAALLCALIFALGLNSIVRCAVWNRSREGEVPAPMGLKKRALRKIPVAIFGLELDLGTSECSICLGEFSSSEKIRVLPKCKHGFHVKCIDKWLTSHSSCPICRCSLLETLTNS